MRVRARGIYCSVDNFQISIVPICWKVSSASCLTNKIEMADSSHWLSRREARFACSASLARRVSLFCPVHPTIGRRLTFSAVAFYRPTASMKSLTDACR